MPDTRPGAKELADLLWEDIKTLPKKEKKKADAIIRLYTNESVSVIRTIIKQEIGIKLDKLTETVEGQAMDIKSIKENAFGNGSSKK